MSTYLRCLVLLAVWCVGPVQAQSHDPTPAPAPARTVTFTPGLRVQVRYAYDNIDGNNDFYIARTRLKVRGDVFGIGDYLAEIKLDNVGRFARDVNAQVEFDLGQIVANAEDVAPNLQPGSGDVEEIGRASCRERVS